MKTVFFFSAWAIIFSFNAYSQAEIGQAEMPNKSSNILYSFGNTNSQIDHTIKGSNQNWDYSSLEYQLQLEEEYKAATSINIFFIGIQNGFGTKTADSLGAGPLMMKDIYDVFKTTSQKMTAEARSLKFNGIAVPQFYSDKDEIYQFPLKYGRNDVSTFKVSFSLANQFSMIQTGTRTNDVEGEGTLKTPYKTYNSVIKIKTVIDQIDSVKISTLPFFPIPRKLVEYKWFSPGVVGPVLIVKGIELAGRFTVQEIKFQDEPVSLVGFESDKYVLKRNETIKLTDTSRISATARTWVITPNTYSFINGTNSGSKSPEIEFSAMGAYHVELLVRNRFGQMSERRTNYIQVLDAVSVFEQSSNFDEVLVFPNPVKDKLNVQFDKQFEIISINNLHGQNLNLDIDNGIIDVSSISPGFYIVFIETPDEIITRKFEKR